MTKPYKSNDVLPIFQENQGTMQAIGVTGQVVVAVIAKLYVKILL